MKHCDEDGYELERNPLVVIHYVVCGLLNPFNQGMARVYGSWRWLFWEARRTYYTRRHFIRGRG